MKSRIIYLLFAIVFVLIGWFANTAYHLPKNSNPIAQIKPTPLLKYTIENLAEVYRQEVGPLDGRMIEIGKVLKDDPKFTSYEFTMKFSPDFSENLKNTSGMINIPKGTGTFPVIVMFRGYVDQKQYLIGEGTAPSAKIFAENGFITVAPDFLGYGDSDTEAGNIFESRFQTYVTSATLLKTIAALEDSPLKAVSNNVKIDTKNIFIWGHSNGGQIALTTLEITGVNYPTVLWAPVSKPFPFSILAYLDEASDSGKLIIDKLAEFNETYDASKFSLTGYFDKIKAPILLNQGTADTSVPYWWSDSLVKTLKAIGVDITYIKYPGANHNLVPFWNQTVENSINYFKSHLTK
ncbi:MAG: prolyl oligopeptidase family serine peptidase [Candidatus Woesebacteria bacterium]|nr:prolyl oligopeptidase family serine peptidase [Candidatus Woesebacteria bacterium]